MKYQSVNEFEKHLGQSAPEQFSSIYLLIVPQEEERKQLIDDLLSKMEGNISKWDPSSLSVKGLVEKLNSPNLFGEQEILVYDRIDQQSPALLQSYIENPAPSMRLILGAANDKQLGKISKKMTILDLSKEKPWEKQRRLEEWLIRTAQQGHKVLTPRAAQLLLEQGKDRTLLSKELDKLIAYVGERREITIEDISTLCKGSSSLNNWQIAERLVWAKKISSTDSFMDMSQFLSLIVSVRTQLQLGEQLRYVAAGQMERKALNERFPFLKPHTLDKYLQEVTRRPPDAFRKGIRVLFELENTAKQGFRSPAILWKILLGKILNVASG